MKNIFLLLVLGFIFQAKIAAQPMVVNADKQLFDIQPTMWGIFFEDINFAADGGLYAELVKNRSFEFFQPLMGWKEVNNGNEAGSCLVLNRQEKNATNPRFIHIKFDNSKGTYGLENSGFRGMGIKEGTKYNFSVIAAQKTGNVALNVELVNSSGKVIGSAKLLPAEGNWKKYDISFTATATDPKAKLNIWFEGAGEIELDMISLFPHDTWKNRPGGLRADLVQLLADMRPGFVRFPGGCIVEGRELATRYQWKKTVGPAENREMIVNRWNTEFAHRPTPDYFQSFGLGFYEYFLLSEDIGAEPLPILSCGLACQFNTAEAVPLDQIDPYIQDALDLIEFANGSTDTPWGKVRAEMGHPAPFNLKMIGIGNEQWGPQYIERYKIFSKVLKEKHPEIKLISGAGPSPDGPEFEYASRELKLLNAEIVDEHYYRNPQWFLENVKRYDNYDRTGYKIFAGEYAAQSVSTVSPLNKNNWLCAISEAAFMTGLERNADVVVMSSYAPLFAHTEGWQWTPDLIWFDNLSSYGTPNYYVQKLFATNKGTSALKLLQNNAPLTGQDGIFASAVFDKHQNEIILKIVNTSDAARKKQVIIESRKKPASEVKMQVLKSEKETVNSIENPKNIYPVERTAVIKNKTLDLHLEPLSLSVVRVKLK